MLSPLRTALWFLFFSAQLSDRDIHGGHDALELDCYTAGTPVAVTSYALVATLVAAINLISRIEPFTTISKTVCENVASVEKTHGKTICLKHDHSCSVLFNRPSRPRTGRKRRPGARAMRERRRGGREHPRRPVAHSGHRT